MSLLRINRLLQPYDYGCVNPLLARLPMSVGFGFAQVRGGIHALLDYDWRSNTLNLRYVRSRVMAVMRLFSSRSSVVGMVGRFVGNAVEEWESYFFLDAEKMAHVSECCIMEDYLELYKSSARDNRGVVLVSAHFGSYCMGIVLSGLKGLRVNAVKSSVTEEDKRIHLSVRNHYKRKYASMEPLMNGSVWPYEGGLDFFYDRLNRGEIVILMGDIPGSKSNVHIDFLGKKLRLPLGAWQMAKKTNALLGAFVTLRRGNGVYQTIAIPPYEVDPEDPVESMMPIYRFLEEWIKRHPEKWLASDLLMGY